MIFIVLLVVAALVLVFFEVILPGGILGLMALGCVIGATILGYMDYGALGGITVFVASLLAVTILIFLEFKLLAKTKLRKGFFLDKSITGHSNEEPAEDSITGQEGITLTRLNPTGRVEIEGESYEAFSQDGYLEANEQITVVAKDNFKLIIKKS